MSRYIIFPTPDSVREINFSCPIRPGGLEESYFVQWLSYTPVTVLSSNNYDISVTTDPTSSLEYQCRVAIQHRSDQNDAVLYNGPRIVLEKKGDIQRLGNCRVSTAS